MLTGDDCPKCHRDMERLFIESEMGKAREVLMEMDENSCSVEMVAEYLLALDREDPRISAVIRTLWNIRKDLQDNLDFLRGIVTKVKGNKNRLD